MIDLKRIPVSSAIRESSSRIPGMSGVPGIAVASRKMSATAIGWVSSCAATAARASINSALVAAISSPRRAASLFFGLTRRK